ncbi:hypothetical protein GH714_027228 [Hevea brasiliensis]|uniref:dCTP pyrophosphatase 1 n=1 Tax=Hevea brasiliensis TaxID=3981 RepID=A0A6A6K8S5_HEVBR|nr:hypothetical protein GH714_027228 [Hevea brasiliensis]
MTGVSDGESVSLDLLKMKMAEFAKERDWDRFHSPRNLLLALVRFCPLKWVKWENYRRYFSGKERYPRDYLIGKRGEGAPWEELSDVLLYLVRLSDICGIDLGKAAMRKVELNAIKYPVGMCKGSSKKHNNNSNSNNGTEK